MFSQPKKLNINLESLDVTYNDLNNIYRKIIKLVGKNNKIQVTLLINNVTNEVLYTFNKVYKTEF